MSGIVNGANMVIRLEKVLLPKELWSWAEEQRHICTNKLMGAPANDSPVQRNLSC